MLHLVKEKSISNEEKAADVAILLLDVIPQAMRSLRNEMRASRGATLTVPHFRILAQLWREPAGNKALAEQLGVSVAAMSRMLNLLVSRGLIERSPGEGDKRCVSLKLTRQGIKHFECVRKATRARLRERLTQIQGDELAQVEDGLARLSAVLTQIYDN